MSVHEYIGLSKEQRTALVGAKSSFSLPLPDQDPRWDQARLDAAVKTANDLGLKVLSYTQLVGDDEIPMTTILADPKSGSLTDFFIRLDERAPLRIDVSTP